jgi:putative membrane protein
MSDRVPEPGEDTRRTYLAQERTLLAWWRSGLAAFAVAIGIGRLVPALLHVSATPFVGLGLAYGALGLAFVFVGAHRDRAIHRHLAAGRFEPLDARVVWTLTGALLILGAATMVLLILVS